MTQEILSPNDPVVPVECPQCGRPCFRWRTACMRCGFDFVELEAERLAPEWLASYCRTFEPSDQNVMAILKAFREGYKMGVAR